MAPLAGMTAGTRRAGRRVRVARLLVGLVAAGAVLSGCAVAPVGPTGSPTTGDPAPGGPATTGTATSGPTTSAPTTTVPPTPSYPGPDVRLVPYSGIVENLFFHPVIAYPELAFNGNPKTRGLDDYMVTVPEFNAMLRSMYDKGYILVNWNDVWSERTASDGTRRMAPNTLMLPEGKKPIVLNFDDVNYYQYMRDTGFTYKLIVGDDGQIWSWGLDPHGVEVISQALDAVTILDAFVRTHPDFSMHGVKGCLNLTGYEGILGYRTQTSGNDTSPAFEARRQAEIAAVKPVIAKLKETGWYFASHTWGHIDLASSSLDAVTADSQRWQAEVGSLIGPTKIFVYPFGSRLDGGDVTRSGPAFRYVQGLGFRIFASVGSESFSMVKTDIDAVICDRMHADGTTLRQDRTRYLKFYDAKLLFDPRRPDYGTTWS